MPFRAIPGLELRTGTAADVPALHTLIQELAEYERLGGEVRVSLAQRQADFAAGHFQFLVAERDGTTLGIALYFFRYSTFRGLLLYLEDLIVTEAARGQDIGRALFDATIAAAKSAHAVGMAWQVLTWNEPAIGFYLAYGATTDDQWLNCRLMF